MGSELPVGVGEVQLMVTTDGGTTWVPVKGDVAGLLHVSVDNALSGTSLPNGQATKANSVPVTMASDQPPIGIENLPQSAAAVALSKFYPANGLIVAACPKASAGNLYGFCALNGVAAVTWLCFYNKATAPTLGSDVPVFAVPIPAGAGSGLLPLTIADFPLANFSTGIAVAAATTAAGAAAPATAPSGVLFLRVGVT